MLKAILVTLIVMFSLVCVLGAIALATIAQHLEKKRQPPAELPEWLQGLTREQLRALLQAKPHKTQEELHAMADEMRVVNQRHSLLEPQIESSPQSGEAHGGLQLQVVTNN